MINASNEYKQAIQADSREIHCKLSVNGTAVSGKVMDLTVTKGCGDKSLAPGSVFASYMQATLIDCTTSLLGQWVDVEVAVNDINEWVKIGEYKIDAVAVRANAIEITGHGRVANAVGTYQTSLSYPATLAAVVAELGTSLGTSIVCTGSGSVTKAPEGSYKEVLGYIAGLCGGYCTDGVTGIVIRPYSAAGGSKAETARRSIEAPVYNGTYAITGVKCVVKEGGEDEEGQPIPEEAYQTGSPNVLFNNPYMTQALFTANVSPLVGLETETGVVKLALGDPLYEPNDSASVTDINGAVHTIRVVGLVQRYHGGLETELSADLITDSEAGVTLEGPLSQALKAMSADLITVTDAVAKRITADDVQTINLNADKITSGTLSADRIAANSLNVDKLQAGTLSGYTFKSPNKTSATDNNAGVYISGTSSPSFGIGTNVGNHIIYNNGTLSLKTDNIQVDTNGNLILSGSDNLGRVKAAFFDAEEIMTPHFSIYENEVSNHVTLVIDQYDAEVYGKMQLSVNKPGLEETFWIAISADPNDPPIYLSDATTVEGQLTGQGAIVSRGGQVTISDQNSSNGYERLTFRNNGAPYNNCYIQAINGDANGSALMIRPGGLLIAGAGEYAQNRWNLNDLSATEENAYIGADEALNIETNGGTIANRYRWLFSKTGGLYGPSYSFVSSAEGYKPDKGGSIDSTRALSVRTDAMTSHATVYTNTTNRVGIAVVGAGTASGSSGHANDYRLLIRDALIGLTCEAVNGGAGTSWTWYLNPNKVVNKATAPLTITDSASSSGSATGATIAISAATSSAAGSMSAADKAYVDARKMYYQTNNSAAITLSSGTITKITLTATNRIYNGSNWAISSGGVKVTNAGRYRVSGSVSINSASGQTTRSAYIYKGTSTTITSNTQVCEAQYAGASSGPIAISPKIVELAANDIVFLGARSQGAASSCPASQPGTYLLIERLS